MVPEPTRKNDSIATFSPNRENRISTSSLQSVPATSPHSPRPPVSSPYGASEPSIPHIHQENEKPVQDTSSEKKTGAKKWEEEVSRKEIIIVIAVILMVLVAAVVAFTVIAKMDSSESSNSVFASNQLKYDFILESLKNSTVTAAIARALPDSIGDLDDVDGEAEAFSLAAKWTIAVDQVAASEHSVLVRYALATLYFAHGGSEWNRANNWMSSEDTCEWEGVACSFNAADIPNVQELDLSSNNLVGTLSPALSLLKDLKILWLDKNDIAGPIRGDVLAALPNLAILYLQDNQLTGPIPKELRSTGMLYTLYLQGNQLTGAWPIEFCPICDEQGECSDLFTNFGVDCQANPCPCCNPSKNCF